MEDTRIDEALVERLKLLIVAKENINLKTHQLSNTQMVSWIQKKIEEELACYSNR